MACHVTSPGRRTGYEAIRHEQKIVDLMIQADPSVNPIEFRCGFVESNRHYSQFERFEWCSGMLEFSHVCVKVAVKYNP